MLFRGAIALVLGIAVSAPAAHAATLRAHYDVNDPNSFVGGVLQDLTGNEADLSPGAGGGGVGFSAPSFVAGGPGSRAFLDFAEFGVLTGSAFTANDLSAGGLTGYSYEGYFRIASDFDAQNNTGIGFTQDTSVENQFLAYNAGGSGGFFFHSQTVVDTIGGVGFAPNVVDVGLDAVLPSDQFFHIVKVHDPFTNGGEVRFYIDGQLTVTVPLVVPGGVEYHPRDEALGNVGAAGREVQGLGYSLTRFYEGVLSDLQIAQNFAEVTAVPEPRTTVLVLLTGAAFVRRARQKKA